MQPVKYLSALLAVGMSFSAAALAEPAAVAQAGSSQSMFTVEPGKAATLHDEEGAVTSSATPTPVTVVLSGQMFRTHEYVALVEIFELGHLGRLEAGARAMMRKTIGMAGRSLTVAYPKAAAAPGSALALALDSLKSVAAASLGADAVDWRPYAGKGLVLVKPGGHPVYVDEDEAS